MGDIIFFSLFACIVGIFIFAFIHSVYRYHKDNHSSQERLRAIVLDKTVYTHSDSIHVYFIVKIDVETRGVMTFRLTKDQYEEIRINDIGYIVIQGRRFISFEKM